MKKGLRERGRIDGDKEEEAQRQGQRGRSRRTSTIVRMVAL